MGERLYSIVFSGELAYGYEIHEFMNVVKTSKVYANTMTQRSTNYFLGNP